MARIAGEGNPQRRDARASRTPAGQWRALDLGAGSPHDGLAQRSGPAGTGEPAAEPAGGDYPAVGEPTAARWKDALDALDKSHATLATVVQGMSDDALLKPTNDPRNRPLGTGVSYYELLHGIVQHDAYHAGQIAILKKVLGI